MSASTCSLFTSFALSKGLIGQHISDALIENLANPIVRNITILTESAPTEIVAAMPELDHESVTIIHFEERPTFANCIASINSAFSDNKCNMAVLANADISFLSEEDACRTINLAESLRNEYERFALSLTRHDIVNDRPAMTLRNAIGLPNTISSDCWVFAAPVEVDQELFYSPGQMFCDQFFNHDLISSKYRIFNPALDCVTIHHESDLKTLEYYQDELAKENAKKSIAKHIEISVRNARGCYYGVAQTRSTAISTGYRPLPLVINEQQAKLYLLYAPMNEERFNKLASQCIRIAAEKNATLIVITESWVSQAKWEAAFAGAHSDNALCFHVECMKQSLGKSIEGLEQHMNNAVYLTDQELLNSSLLDTYSSVFICPISDEPSAMRRQVKDQARNGGRVIELTPPPRSTAEFLARCLLDGEHLTLSWARQYGWLKPTPDFAPESTTTSSELESRSHKEDKACS